MDIADAASIDAALQAYQPWTFINAEQRTLAAHPQALAAVVVQPRYVSDLAHAVLDLVIDGASGVSGTGAALTMTVPTSTSAASSCRRWSMAFTASCMTAMTTGVWR